jgi:hypothetical protein
MIEWQAMSVHGGQLEHCSRWHRKISFCRAIEYPSQKFHAQRPSGTMPVKGQTSDTVLPKLFDDLRRGSSLQEILSQREAL